MDARIIAVPLFCAMLCSPSSNMPAHAQAGSTGGTVGNVNKSLSGEEKKQSDEDTIRHQKHNKQLSPNKSPLRSADAPKGAPRIYTNPTIQGKRVDRCLTYGVNCDEPAATAWCRSKGFSRATSWALEVVSPTYIQESGQTCDGFVCRGFTQIVCQ
jgi:hypothetical protein